MIKMFETSGLICLSITNKVVYDELDKIKAERKNRILELDTIIQYRTDEIMTKKICIYYSLSSSFLFF